MQADFRTLFPYERNALLESLRRDMRQELRRAIGDTEFRNVHLANYRMVLHLLETLNPRLRSKRVDDSVLLPD